MKKALMLLGCALYVLSPIDFIPDVLLGIGWLDDIAVVGLTVQQLKSGRAIRKAGHDNA